MSTGSTALGKPQAPAAMNAPHASTCPQCSGPIEDKDRFCTGCGWKRPNQTMLSQSTLVDGFMCKNCGAQVRCEQGSRATTCPFCASTFVVDLPSQPDRQDPEFVLGFECPADRAEQIYRDWLASGGLFRPRNLFREAKAEGLRGIYLPFWSFSVRADSRWSAQIGEHWYRTETYTTRDNNGKTVTMTRRVQETEWYPLAGQLDAYHTFYLLSASKGLPQDVAEWVEPYELAALKRYEPKYLAGWLSEEYSIDKEAAYTQVSQEYERRQHAAIASFLPGDTSQSLQVETNFSHQGSDLILLPFYVRSYKYKDKLYRILINGQTGKIEGNQPVDKTMIATVVALVIVLGLIIGLLVSGVGR